MTKATFNCAEYKLVWGDRNQSSFPTTEFYLGVKRYLQHKLGLQLAFAALAFGVSTSGTVAHAAQFDQQEVDSDRFIAIAAPLGTISHQLLILEQLSNQRPCWQETGSNPTLVEPLLVEFDFTDICERRADSNSYSVRVGGEDLSWRYSLRIVPDGNDLVLVAIANREPNALPIEIGRTHGMTTDFAKIELNSGWRLTRRTYNGQALSHVYLTHDQDLTTLLAAAKPLDAVVTPRQPATPPATSPAPSPPSYSPSPLPTVAVPTRPTPSPAPVFQGTPPPPTPIAAQLGFSYRVIVQAPSPSDQQRVRAIVPDAFRTTIDGQTVMQAGLFQDSETATALQQRLQQNSLQASILPVSQGIVSPGQVPTPIAAPSPPSIELPSVPRGRTVVVIDPGHGGRDPGAVGIGGLRETDVVLPIAQQVATLLEQQGVQVVMTRNDDREIDLAPRVELASQVDANLFVSIHANSLNLSRPDVNGLETYYYASESGRQLAQSIQDNVLQTTDIGDRGIKQARFYVLTRTSMPAVLVEVGFVTGRDDAALLNNSTGRNQIAEGIGRGILQYIQRNF